MKKTLLVMLMALIAIPALNAQIYTTHGSRKERVVEPKKPRVPIKLDWFLRAGVGIGLGEVEPSYWYSSKGSPDVNSFMNYNLSFGFQSHFRPSNPSKFYWGAELGLRLNTAKSKEFNHHAYGCDYYTPVQSISGFGGAFDLTAGYKTPISSNVSFDIHISPEIAVSSAGRIDCNETYPDVYSRDDTYDLFPVTNFGFKAGLGFWINRVNLDLSVIKLFIESTSPGKYTMPAYLTFSIGYRL